jgi:hypothetical protein
MLLQVRPVIQRRPRGARYNGSDHTWALGLNEAAPREDATAGLRQSAESSEGCPCPFCLCQTSDCGEGLERRVASLPSPQQCPNPIDGPTMKPTTPLVPLINQLRASYSTLVVALLSPASLPKQVLTERYSGKWPKSPNVSQEYNRDNIIVS